jgi:hypothetical protein
LLEWKIVAIFPLLFFPWSLYSLPFTQMKSHHSEFESGQSRNSCTLRSPAPLLRSSNFISAVILLELTIVTWIGKKMQK